MATPEPTTTGPGSRRPLASILCEVLPTQGSWSDETITVLALKDDAYVEHGVFTRGAAALSALLEGFTADVSEVFDAPESGG